MCPTALANSFALVFCHGCLCAGARIDLRRMCHLGNHAAFERRGPLTCHPQERNRSWWPPTLPLATNGKTARESFSLASSAAVFWQHI